MNIAMKSAASVAAVGLLLTACGPSDSRLSQQVVGTWIRAGTGTHTNTYVFSPDGSFSIRRVKAGETNSFTGDWEITDGVLDMTYTDSSDPKFGPLLGGVESWNIVRADHKQLTCEHSGQTNILTRQ